nr:hypothetical protein [Tanacetum cinerariifolium]
DSDSFMEEIDLSFTPDDPMPPGIEEDGDDSGRDIPILEELLDNYFFSLPATESYHFDIPSPYRPPAKPPDGKTETLNIKMMGDVSDQKISELNKQLSKEKSTVSFLLKEKKRLKSDFKTCEDKLLDKQILLEKRIKEMNNIVFKTGQSIQTIHMLSPKPNSFYHTEQKMALGYQNSFYLKQAQKKQQSLYDGKVLLEKHDPPVVHDSEETLQLAQKSRDKMKQMNKEIKPANYTKINHLSGVFVP